MAGLVLGVLESWLTSEAVTEALPAVLSVTLEVFVPATSAALAGKMALVSEELSPTVSAIVLTRFQFTSTALTVTLKGVPAACALGVPALPLIVPGMAVSPGTNNCSFAKRAGLTVTDGLVLAILVPSVASVAVTIQLPAVFRVRLKIPVPLSSAPLAGKLALLSDEVRPTVSVALVTRFQLASTPFTVTLKALPAVCAVGAPVLPVALPGEALSPGARTCSLVKAPGRTWSGAVVEFWIAGWVMSEAMRVTLPAVLRVTLRLLTPLTSAALAGKAAFGSLEVMATVSLVLTIFQYGSAALTVTPKAAPALCVLGVPLLPLTVPGAAVSPGASSCNLLKAPGLTTTLAEVAPARPGLAKSMLIVVATLCERLVKLTTPLTAPRLVAPCKAPLPPFRLAATTVLLSLARKLPN